MIVGSFGRYLGETAHDHETVGQAGADPNSLTGCYGPVLIGQGPLQVAAGADAELGEDLA